MMTEKLKVEEQKLLLEFILSSGVLYARIQNIYNSQNFDRILQKSARFIQEYVQKYNVMPTFQQTNISTESNLEPIPSDVLKLHEKWFLDEFEQFTKREELERAILKSADLLAKGNFEPVEKLIKDAVQVGLTRDLGIDYYDNPRERLIRLKDSNGQISTGWKEVDEKLYGGFNRGELNIFCGGSGSGKSLFLQNISLNWMQAELNGIYITFELSQDLVALRLDSMVTGYCSKDIYKNIDDVEIKINFAGKKCGKLKIKYMPAQSSVNQIKAYVKELAIQEGYKPDFICLDYVDLIMPSSVKVDVSDVFTKDKYVCEELRNYAQELKILLVSASQLNRSGFDEIEFSPSSIAGGISKLYTADNLFGIFTSRIMKERGAIQLQFLKTRNSSGVGNKVDLDFNVNSLRITDSTQTVDPASVMDGSAILSKIKNKNSATNTPSQALNNNDKKDLLKSLLSSIGKEP